MLKKNTVIFAYIAIILIPFYVFRLDSFGLPTNLLEITISISFLSGIIYSITQKKKFHFGSSWAYIFLFLVVIAMALATDSEKAVGILKGWFVVPVMFYLVTLNFFRDQEKITKLLSYFAIPVFLVSVWGILQHFGFVTTLFFQVGNADLDQYLVAPIRAFGPFDSPNSLGMFLAPAICLLLIPIAAQPKRQNRIIYYILLLIPIVALFFTLSRAGIIALAFAAFLYAIISYIKTRKLVLLFFCIIFFIGLVTGLFFSIVPKDNSRAESNSSRTEIYKYSINIIQEDWFKGIGLGGFQKAIDEETKNDSDFQKNTLSYAIHPHNLFLAMWLNLGLLGLLAFIMLIVRFSRRAIEYTSTSNWLATTFAVMAMSTILVHGLFDTTYFKNDLSVIFWLVFGTIYLVNLHEKKSTKN